MLLHLFANALFSLRIFVSWVLFQVALFLHHKFTYSFMTSVIQIGPPAQHPGNPFQAIACFWVQHSYPGKRRNNTVRVSFAEIANKGGVSTVGDVKPQPINSLATDHHISIYKDRHVSHMNNNLVTDFGA